MAKQIIKGLTMLVLIMTVALVTAAASAAYGQSTRQTAKVPFEFVVGDKTLPAGRYDVGAINGSHEVLRIRSTEQNQTALRLTQTVTHGSPSDKSKLVFRRYSDQYFLAEVWIAGETSGRQLMKSKQERAIERQLASIPSKTDWARSGYEIVEVAVLH